LRTQEGSVQHGIFSKLQAFAQLRKSLTAFHGDVPVNAIESKHPTVLALQRGTELKGFFNFSRQPVDQDVDNGQTLALKPYGFVWLQSSSSAPLRTLID
jgi:hypothetical protein